jgi:hypothetical protein
MPSLRLSSEIPASPAWGYSRDSAIVLSIFSAVSGTTANVAFAALSLTLRIGVIVERQQRSPLISITCFQFPFYRLHVVE